MSDNKTLDKVVEKSGTVERRAPGNGELGRGVGDERVLTAELARREPGSTVRLLGWVVLAQSPQFYKQMLVGAGFERVFEVGPVFRAEEHDTSRHLNEYTSLDLEMGFIEGPEDLMALENELLEYLLERVAAECAGDLKTLGAKLPVLPPSGRIPRVHFTEAVRPLRGVAFEDGKESDLSAQEERQLGRIAREEYGSDFVFVMRFPAAQRPFYTMPDRTRPGYTLGFDLIARGMEVTTGGQRIHDHQALVAAMKARGLKPEDLGGYLEVFGRLEP